jgi:translation elongation factor EF-1beta
MATQDECAEAGIDYIETLVDVEQLKKRIDELEQSIKNLHKVKGRHHTQEALESLFKLVGLENNIGEKMSEKTLGQILEKTARGFGIQSIASFMNDDWDFIAQAVIEAHEARKLQTPKEL